MSRTTIKTQFQKKFTFDDLYSAVQIRETVSQCFLPGNQRYSSIYANDHSLNEVPFAGLGEIVFFKTEAEYREHFAGSNAHQFHRASYDRTQRTSPAREQLLIELIPDTQAGLLKIAEINKLGHDPSRYRAFTDFEATNLGYVLRGF